MTDFRALCTELLGALHYAREHKEFPETFAELEARAAAAIAEPVEMPLPLIEEKTFQDAAEQQRRANQATQSYVPDLTPLPPDASPLVRYQERMRRARQHHRQSRVPGAHWY